MGLLFCFSFKASLLAQSKLAQTEVHSFSRQQYAAGSQNWAICQDRYNRLYIANNEGLLVFDGKNWNLIPVPNKTILRSIAFGKDGKLYAGAQDEFGYFSPDKVGRVRFTSLKPLLPENQRHFPDVWQIKLDHDGIFFRTNKIIFRFDERKVFLYPSSGQWLSLHSHLGKVLAHDSEKGIMIFKQDSWQLEIPSDRLPDGFFLSAMMPWHGDTSLICTEKSGFYFYTKGQLIPAPVFGREFNENQYFTAMSPLPDGSFLAGTYFNGLYHISKSGEVLENISNQNGLKNNTIRSLWTDASGKTWMGLDNGIAFFEPQPALRHINPPAFNLGVGYSVQHFNKALYFGLSTGIQMVSVSNPGDLGSISETPKPILKGLSWNVTLLGNQLLAGRDDGLWQIHSHGISRIVGKTGFWNIKSLPDSTQFVAGNYLGIQILKKQGEQILKQFPFPGFLESSRYLETDGNKIWISHPYRGVYCLTLKDSSQQVFRQKDGLPSDLDNHVFKVKGKIVFATTKGIYEFNNKSQRMEKAKDFEVLLGNLPIRYLKEDADGRVWFVQEKMVGVIDFSARPAQIHYLPELKNKIVSGFENIYPFDARNIFVGSDEGFYLLNFEKYKEKIKNFEVYPTQIKTIGEVDSILFGGYHFLEKAEFRNPHFPYRFNALRFAFSATIFESGSNLEFRYFLEGFDKNWST